METGYDIEILKDYKDDFNYQIKQRGKEYYLNGNVLKCIKSGDKYTAKVKGREDKPYTVTFEINEDGVDYDCSCPCDFPCKHEYAALLALLNYEYVEFDLKETVNEKNDTLKSILESIPADEIKTYLLSSKGLDKVCFEMGSFNTYFHKYLPKQSYEYYYNNLYNSVVLDDDHILTNSYLSTIKQYVDSNDYNESFKIIKIIIDVYKDTNKLSNTEDMIDILLKLGMYLRITYRKCDNKLKKEVNNWILSLKKANYYDNCYLEDTISLLERM